MKNNIFPHKLTTNFDSTEFEVVEIKGSEASIKNRNRTFRRNLSHLKKIQTSQLHTESPAPSSILTNDVDINSQQDLPLSPDNNDVNDSRVESESNSTSEDYHPELDRHDRVESLKLKNMGGMWQPVP
jgi:hypothetical protein